MKDQIYIGLMSGTSMDGIDAVAVDFDSSPLTILGTHSEPLPISLTAELHALCHPNVDEINRLGQLDQQLGLLFAKACLNLIENTNLKKEDIIAIGSHGQTIRHQPNFEHPFTLQIGDPNTIAAKTGVTTIADFRRKDMAHGGQGAPLTPAFHQFAFHSPSQNRIILNIGGISNITFLPRDASQNIKGFDCGPGNTLLDQWVKQNLNQDYDQDGKWAKEGQVDLTLLTHLLADPYFKLPFPKSTGREYFNLAWLNSYLERGSYSAQNVQSTLSELTACSIMDAIHYFEGEKEILLCGGGAYNLDLTERLNEKKGKNTLCTTKEYSIAPDWVEAVAFAWLARQTYHRLSGNLPAVTGAAKSAVLGAIYWP